MNNELFQFTYNNPEFTGMRCFLGNGYQSTEISNNLGQGLGVCRFDQSPFPIMRVAGVYSYPNSLPPTEEKRKTLKLDSLFRQLNSFGIYLLDPNNPQHPEIEDLEYFIPKSNQQTLDMKRAVVTTKGQIEKLEFESECFLSRTCPNFGALKINVTKSTGAQFAFQHVVRKDPFTCYEAVTLKDLGRGNSLWELKIREDKYEVQKKGLFSIIQITGIEIFDEKAESVKFTVERSSVDINKLDFNNSPVWATKIHCEAPKISKDQKYRLSIILYFGTYKENDYETPRFASLSPNADLQKRASEGLTEIMKLGYNKLLKENETAWQQDIWKNLIEVPGADEKIQRMLISSFYVMGCTYLEGLAYGNGPNGLNGHWWGGRTFWDHDLWVNLGILLWAPKLARNFNLFRFNTMDGARENRKQDVELFRKLGVLDKYNLKITDGIKYCWESTSSGIERFPDGGKAPNIQEHISCDVIYGMWLQYTVSNDRKFLEQIAFPVAYESAMYIGQRVNKESDGKWHFRYVICADEHAVQKDDNAFTNLYVEKCMKIVIDWCKLLGKTYPAHWDDISQNMKYHFDAKNMRIIEHENYTNEIIKQADTDLIAWPLEHDVVYGENGETIRRNNMLFYFDRLPENHIMMGACIFSIIAKELGMQEKAWEYFADQFPHFHPELSYIPSENPKNDCLPFITGIGGFLSNVIYGFGGIRIREDGLLFDPHLDPNLPNLIIPRIHFQGIEFRYVVLDGGNKFILTNLSATKEFTIYGRNNRVFLPIIEKVKKITNVQGRTEKKYNISLAKDQAIQFALSNK